MGDVNYKGRQTGRMAAEILKNEMAQLSPGITTSLGIQKHTYQINRSPKRREPGNNSFDDRGYIGVGIN